MRNSFLSRQKEAGLIFLALFYFVIATNTQTGWLFVLSAFLLGLLCLSWGLSRNKTRNLEARQSWLSEPVKNRPFRVEVVVENLSRSPLQEIRLESESPAWSDRDTPLRWAVPELRGGEILTEQFRFVPHRRGEHTLPPLVVVSGAPFGLFANERSFESTETFLVYPEIEQLGSRSGRSNLATALADAVSPRGLGDTRSIRTVRDYRSGDDLRQVHWKASAKRAPSGTLMVKEHHAPAPLKTILVLDTSCAVADRTEHPLFEKAVTLTASILWWAHRQGTQTVLFLGTSDRWRAVRQWNKQYEELARVALSPTLTLEQWLGEAEEHLHEQLGRELTTSPPFLITAGIGLKETKELPPLFKRGFQIVDPSNDGPSVERLIRIDGTAEGFQETPLDV